MGHILYTDVRKGQVIDESGTLYYVLDRDLRTPGNLPSKLTLTLKNLKSGYVNQVRVHPEDKVEVAFLETRKMQYLYRDKDEYVFMDSESFDQMSLPLEALEDVHGYIKENDEVQVTLHDGRALTVQPPPSVVLTVAECDPCIPGATAKAQLKHATLETGLKIMVPSFVEQGESVIVNTTTGEYAGRQK